MTHTVAPAGKWVEGGRGHFRALVWLGLPSALTFGLGIWAALHGGVVALVCAGLACGIVALAALRLQQQLSHPLRTAANILDALRHGDYTHRARTDVVGGAVGALLAEINQLAEHLHAARLRADETAALLQTLIERVDVAILAFDDADLLVWWNPAATKLWSSKLREGKRADELGAREFLSGSSERSVTLEGQAAPAAWELRRGVFHRGGRRYRFVLLSSLQRVRREEERAAWQRLVRVLGHEVNNTLAPIQSLSSTCRGMLTDEPGSALPHVLEALTLIEQRSASLGHFISEFARLARLPEPQLTRLDLAAHVRRVVSLDTRCPVHVLGKGGLDVLGDGPLLEQALLNLVQNAIDASLTQNGEVTIDWHSESDTAVLSIVDDGPGIANPDNLFVPLFSTKPGGSGIGLVLTRNIVEAHGGQLRLDNRSRNAGCVARLTLPLAPRQSPDGADGGGGPSGQQRREQSHQQDAPNHDQVRDGIGGGNAE